MEFLPNLLLRAALILLALAPSSLAAPQERPRTPEQDHPTTEEFQDLVERVTELEKLAGVKPDQRPTRPRTHPGTKPGTRPKTRPRTEPRTNPGVWPAVGETRVSFQPTGGKLKRLSFSEPKPDDWCVEEGWRFCVMRRPLDGALFILTLEQFEGFDATRVTAAIVNGFQKRGAVVFDSYSVRTGDPLIYRVKSADAPGPDGIQARGTLARRNVIGPDADQIRAFEHIEPVAGYPDWVGELCAQGLAHNTTGAKRIGIYNIWDPGVVGPSSLDGSHGGWKVAPWHFGAEGWQRGAREGYQWAEAAMFGTLDRAPLACYDPETLRPLNPHVPYWTGRENTGIPGLKPQLDPRVPYLAALERHEAHASSHGQRLWGAAAMAAPFDVWARILLVEHYWHDVTLAWDGAESGYHVLQPLAQVQAELPANEGWQDGGRQFAHALRCFLYAEPYMAPEKRDDAGSGYKPWLRDSDGAAWRPTLKAFLQHVIRPNGIIHIQPEGDDKWGWIPYAHRAREGDLMYPNLIAFGLTEEAEAFRRTMRPINGVSVAEAFDGTREHWLDGAFAKASYFATYDWIREEYSGWNLPTILSKPSYKGPNEQDIAQIWPHKVFEVVK